MDNNRVRSPDVVHTRKKRKKNDETTIAVNDLTDNDLTDKEFSQLCKDHGYTNYGNVNNINNNTKNKIEKKRKK